jgi:hypothetical protein
MAPTRTKVIIINGVQESGKDSFVKLAESYCNMNESANVLNLSSVDPIKNTLESFGWDGEKTEEVRDIIAGIKKIWIGAQNGPTMFMMNNILAFHAANIEEDNIVFCHIREPEEIAKFIRATDGYAKSLLVRGGNRMKKSHYGNYADDSVENYSYDYYFTNDLSIEETEKAFCELLSDILS